MNGIRYVLASASPRRKEILSSMGYVYDVMAASVEEITDKILPEEMVMELSGLKASATAAALEEKKDCVVIGADTLVWHEGKALGKPGDEEEAFEMLKSLSGKRHSVYTGVTLIAFFGDERYEDVFYDCSGVKIREMSEEEIRAYIACGEPMDKAGAYAIQGVFSKYIEAFEGSYNNVVGLPSEKLKIHLEEIIKRRM